MGYVVAVANQKGGVGKTTTAVNLGASLAVAEQRVLLVDVDPQGNATSGLGRSSGGLSGASKDGAPGQRNLDPEQQSGSYSAMLHGGLTPQHIIKTELPNLDLVASTPHLAAAELELVDDEERALKIKQALADVKEQYDYVLLDCPPSLGLLTINALTAADAVIVPMQCEYYALEGLTQLMDTISRIKRALNPELSVHGVLLTMFDPRSNLSLQVAEELRAHFPVYNTVIPRNIRLAEAPSHGKPVVLYDSTSKGSFGYLNLAKEILSNGAPAAA